MEYVSFFVGAGYGDESMAAAEARDLAFIGADAGTIDVGPYQLAGLGTIFNEDLCRHDLRRALRAARRKDIPFVVGSCGGSGSDEGVDWFARMVREIAAEEGLAPFTMARLYAEVDRELVKARVRAGRLHRLAGVELPYDDAAVDRSTRIVGVMGVAPIMTALEAGADVVLAGRTTDSAIFASLPLLEGCDAGVAWHAAKVAECGSAIAQPARPDLLRVTLAPSSFDVSTLTPQSRCTPWSVAAHQLYENGDPTCFVEPTGSLRTGDVVYEPADDATVRISGAVFEPAASPTMKLEGVERAGYQSVAMASYNDRVLLETLPDWMKALRAEIDTKVARVLQDRAGAARLTIRTYGAGDGADLFAPEQVRVPGSDVFLLADVVAPTQALATTVATVAWHTMAHFTTGWTVGFVTAAWPFNPPVIERGPVFRFNVNHAMELDHPLEGVRIDYEEVAPGAR